MLAENINSILSTMCHCDEAFLSSPECELSETKTKEDNARFIVTVCTFDLVKVKYNSQQTAIQCTLKTGLDLFNRLTKRTSRLNLQ